MPEFSMPLGDTGGDFGQLAPFVRGYLEALFFTASDDMESATFADLAPDTLATIIADCDGFQSVAAGLLELAYALDYDAEQAGRDYWFTRNGHGVGYWDRDELSGKADLWPAFGSPRVGDATWDAYAAARENSLGDQLSAVARKVGETDAYLGDDGRVYLA